MAARRWCRRGRIPLRVAEVIRNDMSFAQVTSAYEGPVTSGKLCIARIASLKMLPKTIRLPQK